MIRLTIVLLLLLASCYKDVEHSSSTVTKIEMKNEEKKVAPKEEFKFEEERNCGGSAGTGAKIGKLDNVFGKSRVFKETTAFEHQLSRGDLAYDIPDTMVYASTYRITLRVDDTLSALLTKGMSSGYKLAEVEVSNTMKAVLTGSAFEIECQSSVTQLRKFDRPTVWLWDVTPKKWGDQKLKLKVTCVLKRPGYTDENYDLDVFEVERHIKVNYLTLIKKLITENWKELLGFIFGSGLIAWIVQKVRRRKKSA